MFTRWLMLILSLLKWLPIILTSPLDYPSTFLIGEERLICYINHFNGETFRLEVIRTLSDATHALVRAAVTLFRVRKTSSADDDYPMLSWKLCFTVTCHNALGITWLVSYNYLCLALPVFSCFLFLYNHSESLAHTDRSKLNSFPMGAGLQEGYPLLTILFIYGQHL